MGLSWVERRILEELRSGAEYTLDQLESITGIPYNTLAQALPGLVQRKGIVLEEKLESRYYLTQEGREYAIHGLPERILIQSLSGKPAEIKELSRRFPQDLIRLGLGWALRKRWCSISQGKIFPEAAPEGEDERALAKLLSQPGSELDPEIGSELLHRNLVEVRKRRIFKLKLGAEGLKLLSASFPEEITQLTPDMIKSGEWRKFEFKPYDLSQPGKPIFPAKLHPYGELIQKMRSIMLEMGFDEISGDIIQPGFWNFDALFQPQDHPARDLQDTFYLDLPRAQIPQDLLDCVRCVHETGAGFSLGWGGSWDPDLATKWVLRTHTTTLTIRYLAQNPQAQAKVFCIGRVYRREKLDPTHLPEFDQLEGIVAKEDANFRELLGYLSEFYRRMGFPQIRFRPGYFPYTEPSVEVEVSTKHGWIELGGAGIFRQEVTRPLGIRYPVLAFGLGVTRMAMLILDLEDIRSIYQNDLGWLRRFPGIRCQL